MLVNYHSHTTRCHHATGTEREYIEKAINSGFDTLGFSDHSPYPYEDDHYSFRMRPEECEDYTKTLISLREEYKDKIKVLIGYEIEYYPDKFGELLNVIDKYEYDFLILGQHYLSSKEDNSSFRSCDSEENLIKYVDTVIEGMSTGRFLYVAHPDVLNYTGDEEIYNREMSRICKASIEYDVPLELNLYGLKGKRAYPNEKFLFLEGKYQNKVIFGSDAHQVEMVCDGEIIKEAEELVKKYNLNLIERII